nr:DNA N-6-adenine-methyltransferase [Vibrio fluvialis]
MPPDWIAGRRDWPEQLKRNNLPDGGAATCVGFDGLLCDWEDGWWCNPPFDRKIEFIQKATEEMFKGRDGMMLLPYEPLSGWWIDLVDGFASVVYEPNGRYSFYEADGYTKKTGVNFGSVLLLFTRRKLETPRRKFTKYMADAIAC